MITRSTVLTLLLPGALAFGTARVLLSGDVQPRAAEATTRPASAPAAAAPVRFVVAPTGNEARYLVNERLVGVDLPYQAIGKTSDITGALVFDTDGSLVAGQSRLVINVTKLTSDKERRDGFVQRRLLETEKYPTVQLVPTAVRGLPRPLPTAGRHTFDMTGNLTVRGVTKPTTWRVTANFQGGRVTGRTWTKFTFADFEMQQPKVPVVLSLADTIGLEYDFTLVRAAAGATN